MNDALRFHVNREGLSYWIHGRDMPGYPASHGCIGLYDELMQKEQYGVPKDPELFDAERLFVWVLGSEPDDDHVTPLPAVNGFTSSAKRWLISRPKLLWCRRRDLIGSQLSTLNDDANFTDFVTAVQRLVVWEGVRSSETE